MNGALGDYEGSVSIKEVLLQTFVDDIVANAEEETEVEVLEICSYKTKNNPGGFQRGIKVVSASKKGLLQTFALLVTLL